MLCIGCAWIWMKGTYPTHHCKRDHTEHLRTEIWSFLTQWSCSNVLPPTPLVIFKVEHKATGIEQLVKEWQQLQPRLMDKWDPEGMWMY